MNNRVLEDLYRWQERENNMRSLFNANPANDRHHLKSRLEHYEHLQRKYKKDTQNYDERYTLKLLKAETRQVRKAVYPSRTVRWARSVGLAAGGLLALLSGKKIREKALTTRGDFLNKEKVAKVLNQTAEKVKENTVARNLVKKNNRQKDAGDIDLLPKNRVSIKKGLGI